MVPERKIYEILLSNLPQFCSLDQRVDKLVCRPKVGEIKLAENGVAEVRQTVSVRTMDEQFYEESKTKKYELKITIDGSKLGFGGDFFTAIERENWLRDHRN